MRRLQIGNTPLYKSIELAGRCSGAIVYVKREDKNPFDTFKDRRCAALVQEHAGKKTVFVHITSGNSGYSLGMIAKIANETGQNMTVVNVVQKGTPKAIRKKLAECSIVHEMELTRRIINEDSLAELAARLANCDEKDVVAVESYGLVNGYRQIIREMAAEGVKPTHIFCPVGGGELATELAAQAAKTWPYATPKIVGVTIPQNVLTRSNGFLKKPKNSIADKLVSGYSKFGYLVKQFVAQGKMELVTAGERELAREYKWLNGVAGILAEPSAAAAFCGAVKYKLEPTDKVVIINTGKGIYDQSAVEKRWLRRLARGLKYAAVALGTAAVLTVAGWSWLLGQERIAYESLANEARLYADKDRNNYLDREERTAVFWTIPGRGTLTYENFIDTSGLMELDICDLTPRELEFYVRYKRADLIAQMDAGLGVAMMGELRSRYENGAFRPELLHPSVPFLYHDGYGVMEPR